VEEGETGWLGPPEAAEALAAAIAAWRRRPDEARRRGRAGARRLRERYAAERIGALWQRRVVERAGAIGSQSEPLGESSARGESER
ncbi:MAG: hypothetical protein R3244_08460, partial [Thermoanaerobaculia bacterium]|nr:hypothetical protein [Thermoanaerobaculia bacterium]